MIVIMIISSSEGYEAKFWDCCGNEDKNASGCRYNYHQSYS